MLIAFSKLNKSLPFRCYGFFWHDAKLSIALVERTKENTIEVTGARIHRCNPHTGPSWWFNGFPIPFSIIVHYKWIRGCYLARATAISLPCGWYLLLKQTFSARNRAYTSSVSKQHSLFPAGQHTLVFSTKYLVSVRAVSSLSYLLNAIKTMLWGCDCWIFVSFTQYRHRWN